MPDAAEATIPLPEAAKLRPLTKREALDIIKGFPWWMPPKSDLTIQKGQIEPLDEDMRFPVLSNGTWWWRNTTYRWVTRGTLLLREVIWYDDVWRFTPVWAYALTESSVDMTCPFYGSDHMRSQWLDYLAYVQREQDDPLNVISMVRRPERRQISVRVGEASDGVVLLSPIEDIPGSVQSYLQLQGPVGGPYKVGATRTLSELRGFPGVRDVRDEGDSAVVSFVVTAGDMPESLDRQQVLADLRSLIGPRPVRAPGDILLRSVVRADIQAQTCDGAPRHTLLRGGGKSLVWVGEPRNVQRRRHTVVAGQEAPLQSGLHLLASDGTILRSMPQPQGLLQVLSWPEDVAEIARAFRVSSDDVLRLCRIGWTGDLD